MTALKCILKTCVGHVSTIALSVEVIFLAIFILISQIARTIAFYRQTPRPTL